jgi:PAS domain S-box-containing protein
MPVSEPNPPVKSSVWNRRPARYVFALAAVAAAFLLRAGLERLAGGSLPTTYITFYPAVMLSALLGGVGPGLLATAAAALGVDYFMLSPVGSFAVANVADAVGLVFFTGMGVFMSVVAELYRRARQQTADNLKKMVAARTAELAQSNEQLKTEISEHKRAGQQLRLLSTAVESAVNGVAITDRTGAILWINPAFTRMTGYSRAEAEGKKPRILKSGRHSPEFYRLMWETLVKGEPWHGELVNRRKNGSLYSEEMTITPVRADGAEVTHYVAIKQDITARKRAERRTELLAETAARLLSSDEPQLVVEEQCGKALEFLDCQVFLNFLADDKQQRLHLNARAGVSNADAAKLEWLDYGVSVSGCAARDARRIVACNIQETDDPRNALVKSYGIQAYACHPLIAAERLLGTLSFGTRARKDFTEEELSFMKAVSDLVATAIERKRTQTALHLTAEEAKRSNRDLEQFAYIASHDLQEPLRAVGGYVRLLQRRFPENMDPKALQYINGAAEGADRMERLITDLLAFSRVGTHGGAFSSARLDAILDEALRNLHSSIESAGVKVTRDPLPALAVDATQVMQIFQNLIGNAIKFRSERPPEIHVAARREPGRWVFTVRDNGIGIEPQYFERIFQIFQRLHTRAHYPGTGIGLAICKKMVERHGGVIWVESQPGQGSAFNFSLPDTGATNQPGA